jgi:hypothetical protein
MSENVNQMTGENKLTISTSYDIEGAQWKEITHGKRPK